MKESNFLIHITRKKEPVSSENLSFESESAVSTRWHLILTNFFMFILKLIFNFHQLFALLFIYGWAACYKTKYKVNLLGFTVFTIITALRAYAETRQMKHNKHQIKNFIIIFLS